MRGLRAWHRYILADRQEVAEKFLGYVRVVADEAEACADTYFRHLIGDQWEIRVQQGNANHRFYGFLAGRVFYIVLYLDKRWRKARPKDLERVAWVRGTWLRMTDEH